MYDLKIGSVIRVKNSYFINFFRNKIGEVCYLDPNYPNGEYDEYCLVSFSDFYLDLHNGGGRGPENRCWWIESKYFDIIKSKKVKKIKKVEIDPFEEEDWGHVQESLSLNEIKIGNKVRLSKNFKIENMGDVRAKMMSTEIGVIVEINKTLAYPISVMWSNSVKEVYKTNELELLSDKIIKKIENPKIDPFGEEDWGFVQESSKVESYTLWDKYCYFVKISDGNALNSMLDYLRSEIVGNIVKFKYENGFQTDEIVRIDYDQDEGFEFFAKNGTSYHHIMLDYPITYIKNRLKIKNPDIDPFGEENWGYVLEDLELGTFEIGDLVFVNEKYGILDFRNKIGKIVYIDGKDVLVEFDSRRIGEYILHNGNDVVKNNGNCWWIATPYLSLFEERKNKYKEIDPFGEEKWWE